MPSALAIPRLLVALLALLFSAPGARAQDFTFPARPAQGQYIADEARLIAPDDAAAIRTLSAQVDQERRIPIVVVTIPSLAAMNARGASIERYAGALFDAWGIGYKDYNFGILLLISAQDRQLRIELGAGWKFDADDDTRAITQGVLIPAFKSGRYSAGIRAAVEALAQVARGNPTPTRHLLEPDGSAPAGQAPPASGFGGGTSAGSSPLAGLGGWIARNWPIILVIVLVVGGSLFNRAARGGWNSPYTGAAPGMGGLNSSGILPGIFLGSMMSRGSSHSSGWGSSSSGGGGFSSSGGFGGGFSGGGGSSGSW